MGFLDRLRGRGTGTDGAATSGHGPTASPSTPSTPGTAGTGDVPGAPGGTGASDASGAPGGSGAVGAVAPPVAVAAWTGLPPIQRATGDRRAGVADSGFGGRLPTWQNPSFSGVPSPAVLDPAAGHGLLSGAFTESAQPATAPPSPGPPSASRGGEPAARRIQYDATGNTTRRPGANDQQ
ncbi:hypothetical protein K3A88_35980, partial [Streptomyces geysiriensis]|nr:hypothetical protein [Streptomyces geysiriensis]